MSCIVKVVNDGLGFILFFFSFLCLLFSFILFLSFFFFIWTQVKKTKCDVTCHSHISHMLM